MPVLPSGLKLALLIDHIMEPDRNWFKAPENHFWLWTPAKENRPPFSPDQVWEQVPETAPIPSSREMMEKYVRVCIGLENGMMYWRGEMLSEFPKYGALSEEDSIEWRKWLETEKVGDFLDHAIEKCKIQAAINQDATGYVVLTDVEDGEDGTHVGNHVVDNPLKNSN